MENTNQKTELGALWIRKTKADESFYSGKLNLKSLGFDKDVEVIIFNNRNKTAEKHPDLKVFLSTPRAGGPAPYKPAAKTPTSAPQPSTDTQIL